MRSRLLTQFLDVGKTIGVEAAHHFDYFRQVQDAGFDDKKRVNRASLMPAAFNLFSFFTLLTPWAKSLGQIHFWIFVRGTSKYSLIVLV